MNILKRMFDAEYKELLKFEKLADEIELLDEEMSKLKDSDFKKKTDEFVKLLEEGMDLEELIIPAFALAREACFRTIKEKPYRVQLIGGLAIHYGNIAEMKTGEGKTLTTVLPAYLNALTKKGVHVVTTNEYLSTRNAEWMMPAYNLLGVSVGINERELTPKEKQDAYNADVTYSTNNEVGFDYLRDNMVVDANDRTQRPLNFCIIDEVDSILIDEARTPLIISGGKFDSKNQYLEADQIAKTLKNEKDYTIDGKTKSVSITAEGSLKVEKLSNINNLYDLSNTGFVHHLNQALKANYGFKKDVDYVVEEDQIIIVDQFTGRLMHGRQYSDGLHQAIEAKENVTINEETKTMATITFQNLFRMYNKLSGMTGTAKTEEEEFRSIYNMYVIRIPTNKPVVRVDNSDLVYTNIEGKLSAMVKYIREVNKKGQPILIGTISVESNEMISSILRNAGLKHEILNAKNHAREAEIIEKAGNIGSITLATNMAGRGTDIKLGKGVIELGGLCVIGTERHESRRIDNQLRGRSGRQGDPGMSQFFVSFEDDLMMRFGTDRIKNMIESLGIAKEQAITSKTLTKSLETAQKKVEGNNYDVRKNLLDFDNVLNQQREIIYERRNEILDQDNIHERTIESFENAVYNLCESHIEPEGYLTESDKKDIINFVNSNYLNITQIDLKEIINLTDEETPIYLLDIINKEYNNKVDDVSLLKDFEKAIALRVIDTNWVEHMSSMEQLKEGIGLRGYSQVNPIQAYTIEGFEMFDKYLEKVDSDITTFLLKAEVRFNTEREQTLKGQASSGEDIKRTPKTKKEKPGRNDLCTCGSGKKYKHCCGR